ncbi:hypothetical protein K5E40_03700 [Pseudomonas baetica]|uniref:hypothetical protein n=1 Tax=Pseudomonas baetica TaxID=674054 RepID=UPI001C8CDFA5|nr:hypothetical protein [Pseudomonas baetica]MBX9404779.1 hypothetical protein [Pseudomonas baetica]
MNARFNAMLEGAQRDYDNRLPPPVSETPEELARAEWLYNAVEQLVRFRWDVKVQRRMCKPQVVTTADFDLAVDEHVNRRLADYEVGSPALGRLLNSLASSEPDKNALAELLGHSDHSLGMLGEIAEKLLQPLVDDALIAQAEDGEL